MLEFEIQRSTRKCHATERELKPGEKFYSVLVPEGADVARYDYALEAWQGPPENAIGWWQAEVPDPQAKKVNWAPNDVMLHLFQQWESDPTQADIRYVLTLLMVRRRILRLEEMERSPEGEEAMVVFCQANETEYKVPVHELDAQRAASIQDELAKLLFSHS